MVLRRVSKEQLLEFLEHYFSQPTDHLGRAFLNRFFPGVEDPDVTEPDDVDQCIHIIDERYVMPMEAQA